MKGEKRRAGRRGPSLDGDEGCQVRRVISREVASSVLGSEPQKWVASHTEKFMVVCERSDWTYWANFPRKCNHSLHTGLFTPTIKHCQKNAATKSLPFLSYMSNCYLTFFFVLKQSFGLKPSLVKLIKTNYSSDFMLFMQSKCGEGPKIILFINVLII